MANIADSYELREIEVASEALLLDPRNPRIILTTDQDYAYKPIDLASSKIQDYIFSIVDRKEFNVKKLIDGIYNDGFLDQGNRMIVKKVERTGKYLVLEGNRRLTAIRHILHEGRKLEPHVERSLRRVRVDELIITGKGDFSEEQIELKLLGMIHLNGPLEWGAMERAHYIYRYYMQQLAQYGADSFWYYSDHAAEVAKFFNMSTKEVRKQLAIYRVYLQLKEERYPVQLSHFSLIDLAVKTRQVNNEFFELQADQLEFSRDGLRKFADLCIGEDRLISNPADFSALARTVKDGTETELNRLLERSWTLDQVISRIEGRSEQNQFRTKLEKLRDQLGALEFLECRGSGPERRLVKEIEEYVRRLRTAVDE
jgi:hypothetical protein